MLNPISVVETVLLGYLLAVGLQALLTAVYTRAGRGLLMTADEQWSGAYYAITGCAWAMSLAITTFFVLPLSEVNGRKQATEVAVLIAAAVIAVVLYRNRSLNPRLQSVGMMLFLSLLVFAGSVAGAVIRARHPMMLNFFV